MPDQEGKLTQEEKDKVRQWVVSHWQPPIVCPICKKEQWGIADHLVIPVTIGPNLTMMLGGGVGYPQVMLVSQPCGYTMFLNATLIGIVPQVEVPSPIPPLPGPTKVS